MKGIRLLRGAGDVSIGPPLTEDEIVAAVEAAERSPWCRARRLPRPAPSCMAMNSAGEACVEVRKPAGVFVSGGALRENLKDQARSAADRAVEAVEALRSGETARVREWLAGLVVGDPCGVVIAHQIYPAAVTFTAPDLVEVSYAHLGGGKLLEKVRRSDGYAFTGNLGSEIVSSTHILPIDHPRVAAAFTRERVESLRREVATTASRCNDESRLRSALDRLTIEV